MDERLYEMYEMQKARAFELEKENMNLREENRALKEALKPYLDQIESPKIKRIVLKRVE